MVSVSGSSLTGQDFTATHVSSPGSVGVQGGDGRATIAWSSVAGATSYNLYWSTTSGVTTTTGTKISGASSPYVQTGLTNGLTYYYIVTAVAGGVEGSASSELQVVLPTPTGISGWWDLYVPAVQAQKVDAYYWTQAGTVISGMNILNMPFTGTVSGTSVILNSSPAGDSFAGTVNGDSMTGTYTKNGAGSFSANFTRSTFHFTNFYPGEVLQSESATPQFTWTAGAGAEKYFIMVMKDNAAGNCHEVVGCIGVWSKDGIAGTVVTFNSDGSASEPLAVGNKYRVRVYSRTNSQTGIPQSNNPATYLDTTMDVAFTVSTAPSGMVSIPAGSFQMGSVDGEGYDDELPAHTVTVSAFSLDKYEVTKALWDEVYTWATAHGYGFDNAGAGMAAQHPVQTVSWYDVIKWLNARSEK